ncbi:Tripartite tricarboxylate transporter family receptor [compost metagenome]
MSTSPFGIAGPRDMDTQAVQVLHDAFRKALNEPAMQKLLERLDQENAYLNSADYAAFARQRYESQGKLVKRLGLTANP